MKDRNNPMIPERGRGASHAGEVEYNRALCINKFQMRRGLSLFLILFFGFGSLALGLSATSESRLPPCCRRHGKHHCAMYPGMMPW